MAQEHDLGIKTDELPITTEAKVVYLTNCLRQYDYIKAQQENGVEHPKIKLDLEYARRYYQHNDLAQRDIAFHVYAEGVQMYRWDGTSWIFVAPEAVLFADVIILWIANHYLCNKWMDQIIEPCCLSTLLKCNVYSAAD